MMTQHMHALNKDSSLAWLGLAPPVMKECIERSAWADACTSGHVKPLASSCLHESIRHA